MEGGVLLLLITKDVNVPLGAVSRGDVEALGLLAELAELLDGLGVKLNLLEVLTDARGGDGLGDDEVAVEGRPGEDDLGGGDGLALGGAEALGDGLDLGDVDEEGEAPGVVAKGGVGGQDDALLLEVCDELGVGEARVALDLVDGGDDAGVLDDGLELGEVSIHLLKVRGETGKTYVLNGKVGDTN